MIKIYKVLSFLSAFIPLLVIFIYVSLVYSRLFLDPPSMMVGESTSYNTYAVAALYNGITQFGKIILWDNQISSGSPAIGNSFYQQTNPFIYLLFFLFGKSFLIADRAYFFIHLLAAAGFFYLLTRYLKVGAIGSIVGSVVFISSQYVIAFTMYGGYRTDLVFITWLPLVFLLLLRSLDKLSVLTAAFAGLAFSMFVHEGAGFNTHLAMIFLTLAASIYVLSGLLSDKSKDIILKLVITAKIFVVFLLFAFMFSAIKLLPVMEYLQYSNRSEYTLEQSEAGITWFHYWHTLLKPAFTRFFWTINTDLTTQKNFLYIHFMFYLLIFFSLLSKKKKIAISLFFVSIFAIITGAAQNSPIDLYALFYHYFPGFKSVRVPPRFLVFLWLALPLLVALGIGWLVKIKSNKNLFLRITSILGLMLIFAGIPTLAFHSYKSMQSLQHFSYIPSAVDSALLKLKNIDPNPHRVFISYHGADYNKNTMPMYRYTATVNSGYSDMAMNIYNDAKLYYYDVYAYDSDPLFSEIENEKIRIASKRWSILNTKYFALSDNFLPRSSQLPPNPYIKVAQTLPKNELEPRATIVEVSNLRQRFSFIPQGVLYISDGNKKDPFNIVGVRKIIFDNKFDLEKSTVFSLPSTRLENFSKNTLTTFDAIVLGDYQSSSSTKVDTLMDEYQSAGGKMLKNLEIEDLAKQPAKSQFKIKSLKETPGSLEIDFEADNKGFFVYSNSYFPGWEAFLDGEKVPVFMADSYVKGVVVPSEGQHRLRMYYSPKSFYIGATITALAFITLIYLIIKQSTIPVFGHLLWTRVKNRSDIPPEEYSKDYLLSNYVEGYSEYKKKALSVVKLKQLEMLNLKKGLSILEVGYGRGELLYHCSQKGMKVTGIDYSEDAFEIAEELLKDVPHSSIKVADARCIPFPPNSFDRVFAGDVIEHLNFEDGIQMLKEMQRVVKPGGFLLIHTAPNTVFTKMSYKILKFVIKIINREVFSKLESHLKKGDELHIHEYNHWSLKMAARRAELSKAKIWIDEDILRSGKYKLTKDLYKSFLVKLVNRYGKFRVVRFFLGNDLYLRFDKG